ncbi:MAG: ABC transporter permease [Actinomycetia bacterium]|nr:ABC transporter permease [Actinomycetes bacterium]
MKTSGAVGKVLLSVYFVLFMVFLLAPLVVLVVFAFDDSTTATLPLEGWTTHWFSEAFTNGQLTNALVRSATIAAVAAVIATALGLMASVGLTSDRLRLRSLTVASLMLPLVVPYISLAVGLVILLQAIAVQTSLTAVVLGHVVIALPFAILVLLPRLRTLDPSMNEAARDLGAGDLTAFRLITLPLLGPALVSSFLISFVTSFDEFAIASFLAPAGQPTYPVFLYASSRTPALLPQVIAIGTLVIALSMALVLVAEGGRRWAEKRLVGDQEFDDEVSEDNLAEVLVISGKS